MSWRDFFSFGRSSAKKPARDAQLDTELRFHIDALTKENIAAGMSPAEARRQAQLEFGGHEQIKEELRDVYRVQILDAAKTNLKAAFRFLRKSPSFSIAVILTLALGIGANCAVFSAIDAILLKPLPFPESDQIVKLGQLRRNAKTPQTFVAPVRLEDWNRMNTTFQAMTGYYTEQESETTGELPEKVTRALVSPRFLQVWGVAPAIGRDFTIQEEHVGGPDVVIISDRYWRNRFGADPQILSRKIRVGTDSHSIVGVMPSSFHFPERDVDLWSPIPVDAKIAQIRDATWYFVVGRMKPGVTVEQARANLATVQAQLGQQFPKPDAELEVLIEPLKETTVGGVRQSLWTLFGSVSLLLLIACTNIVSLLLARATQRQHEIAVRYSLGASRGAIVAQLLTEAFVLAVAGAALGLLLAWGAADIFRALAANLPRIEEIHLDARVVLYALACSVVVTLLCGLFPALRGTKRGLSGSLAQSSRTQVLGRNRFQWLLVGLQVALAVTLLAGAGLLLRSFEALGRVSPGFEFAHVLTLHISASWGETANINGLSQRIDRILDTIRATPGVENAATTMTLPGVPGEFTTDVRILEGEQDPSHKIVAESRFVSHAYFDTMKIPTLAGEGCREKFDAIQVIVNRSFADTYLQGQMGIGKHIEMIGNSFLKSGEIKGVVADARELGMNRAPAPTVYWCWNAPSPDPNYLVRTVGDQPMTMAQMLRQKIHEIEPGRSVFDITPLSDRLDDAFAENRMRTVLLAFFAATAISLACVGLYGTLSYSLTLRRREVGLRLALGAARGEILKRVLLEGAGVAALGCIAGCVLALAFARTLAGMLYGVTPYDPITLAIVIALVLVVALVASLIPAVRAAHVEPMQVLREE
ncbi:MAG TPA: ABC transporter permease [Candidatus Eremiobacteraceae bacterium]|jgi:putative ABC transport system permease protein|nr:ABC transporter permease [Candidatus Eremiobacteraceae bacterium]